MLLSFIPLWLLRDRLLLALVSFRYLLFLFCWGTASHCCFFFVFLFSHFFSSSSTAITSLSLSSLFSLCFLCLLCPPTYTPSLAHDLLPPPSFPPPHYPPPLSPAPGCQTLPSRPRGKAKAVDFSPHQAFWQLYLLSLCCLCRPKCRQASLATKTFSNWQIITCTRY